MTRALAGLLVLVILGCGLAPGPGSAPGQPAPEGDSWNARRLPVGLGRLHQDQITIALRSGPLLVKVTPLEEAILRLTAPDTYQRLHSLAESVRPAALEAARDREAELFLVSFFSYEPETTFQPEDLHIMHQGRMLRPAAVVPITPGWGRQRLQQQATQSAVYAFSSDLDLSLPMIVRYGFAQSDAWMRILPRIEAERVRVEGRAGAQGR